MSEQKREEESKVDPTKIVIVLDYDDICYRLRSSQFAYFKTSFALTVANIVPDFKAVIRDEDRAEFEDGVRRIQKSKDSQPVKDHKIRLREAFFTAVAGWEEHRDAAVYFTSHLDNPHEKEKMTEDLDRMAHAILPTHLWEPIEGLAKDIEKLRGQGAEVVIWTHGRHEMVHRTLQQNGLLGLFDKHQVFDKQTVLKDGLPMGRKDTGAMNWHRLCEQLGALPENVGFIDDTHHNHKSAAKAGIGHRIHVNWHGQKGLGKFTHHTVRKTSNGMKKLVQFVKKRKEYLARHEPKIAANVQNSPSQPMRRQELRGRSPA